ncbi:alkaline phosphatase PafA [Aquimarina amphilecti]|nr:alkaline phosphatase PafA [Aquimarina amphilecti]
MKKFLPMLYKLILVLFASCTINAQQKTNNKKKEKPRLIVGIVVDQMRYDYLTRFDKQFGDGGFKRIINQGFSFKNHHIDYIPTTTAPGHASIFTGTTPENHGIIGNSWFDKNKKQKVYCVQDGSVSPVGTSSSDGRMSPSKLIVTTIADQNRLHTQMRGKTISIGIKDRGAILSGGHTANAAYWFRGKNQGNWISSSFYMEKLPQWVITFNESNIVDNYFKNWNTYYDIDTYLESGPDDTKFERGFKEKEKPTFPYNLEQLKAFNGNYDILKHTPYGNSLTIDFAIAAIKAEKLGNDNHTDFLNISFSSTDYIGHNFGVNSKEVQDTYIRLDKDLEKLLNILDIQVGKNKYSLFLTSDHGATHVPQFLNSKKIPASYFKQATTHLALKNHIVQVYKTDSVIANISNDQIYMNNQFIEKNNLNSFEIQNKIASYLLQEKGINRVFTRRQLEMDNFEQGTLGSSVKKGFNAKRSGDICYVLSPATIAYSKTGSSHGSGYSYDTHVPLLFYGLGINQGFSINKSSVSDIAPTISELLDIAMPNGTTGNILKKVLY